MLNYRRGSVFLRGLLLMSILWTAGCTNESTTDCQTTYLLNVKAYASVGGTDASADVNDVILYIFDDDDLFVEEIITTVGSTVPVSVPKGESVTIVAWGNLLDGNQTRSILNVGDPLSSGCVDLIATRTATRLCLSPGDLFHGNLTLTKDDLVGSREIPMYRKTGRMAITIKGWESYFPDVSPEDISITVSETYGSLNFRGAVQGEKVAYTPLGALNVSNEYYVAPFNMVPADNITIIITAAGYAPMSVTSDSGGGIFSVVAGETTNVLLDLRVSIIVSVSMTPWGVETIWKDF